MADFYIDPENGNDISGNGSIENPYKTFSVINSNSLWQRGNAIKVKSGTTMLVTSSNRANIVATSGSGRCILTSYGNGELPIIDGGYSTHNPIWIREGSSIDISNIQVTKSASIGLKISPLSGKSVDDVKIINVRSFRNGIEGSTGAGSTGILVTREIGGISCSNVIVDQCVSEYNIGHGIKFSDCSTGKVVRCRSSYNGQGAPAHGMGTVGAYVWLNMSNAWTNTSGNVWSINIGSLGSLTNGQSITASQTITEWFSVTAGDSVSITTSAQSHLSKSSNPTNPGPNEFGISGANNLLVNLNGLDPRTLFIKGSYNS